MLHLTCAVPSDKVEPVPHFQPYVQPAADSYNGSAIVKRVTLQMSMDLIRLQVFSAAIENALAPANILHDCDVVADSLFSNCERAAPCNLHESDAQDQQVQYGGQAPDKGEDGAHLQGQADW